ncbi:hypothetical protein AOLI_G00221070 [Acnodon oligacanthus]
MTHQLMLVHATSQPRQKGPAKVEHPILRSCGPAHIKVTEGGLYWCSDFPGHLLPNFTSIFKPKHLSLQSKCRPLYSWTGPVGLEPSCRRTCQFPHDAESQPRYRDPWFPSPPLKSLICQSARALEARSRFEKNLRVESISLQDSCFLSAESPSCNPQSWPAPRTGRFCFETNYRRRLGSECVFCYRRNCSMLVMLVCSFPRHEQHGVWGVAVFPHLYFLYTGFRMMYRYLTGESCSEGDVRPGSFCPDGQTQSLCIQLTCRLAKSHSRG